MNHGSLKSVRVDEFFAFLRFILEPVKNQSNVISLFFNDSIMNFFLRLMKNSSLYVLPPNFATFTSEANKENKKIREKNDLIMKGRQQ